MSKSFYVTVSVIKTVNTGRIIQVGRIDRWLEAAGVDPKRFRAVAARQRAATIAGGQPKAADGKGLREGGNAQPTPSTQNKALGNSGSAGDGGDHRRPGGGNGKLALAAASKGRMSSALLSGRRMTTIMRL
jgi:hypothetical protein